MSPAEKYEVLVRAASELRESDPALADNLEAIANDEWRASHMPYCPAAESPGSSRYCEC